jgi:hypothetical protein
MLKYMVVLILAGCAAAPPPQPLTREQRIINAVALEYQAGHDGEATYEKLHLQWCLYDAQQLPAEQRSPAIAQCRVDWPQRPDATVSISSR